MSLTCNYLIQYGRPGFVGRFRSALQLGRGERIVLRGPRGIELGEVLVPLSDRFANTHTDGEVLRVATHDDDGEVLRLEVRAQELLLAASDGVTRLDLPLAFVDVEVTLDAIAILHALPWDECDATSLLDDLASRFGLVVRLLDLSRAVVPGEEKSHGGCGKPGCGSEAGGCSTCGTGGGCSSGSCSRGAAKSADELSEYFADLRRKMEAAGMVRTPLN
jgi:hypothetical protein